LAHDLIRKPVPTFRDHARYFAGSLRRTQLIAAGWQVGPMLEHPGSPPSWRAQVRHPSVHS
jgi:hypothetical protein